MWYGLEEGKVRGLEKKGLGEGGVWVEVGREKIIRLSIGRGRF